MWSYVLYIAFEGDDSAIQWCQFCVSLSGSLLTITVRQAAVAAQRTMTFQYGRPLEQHSYHQVLKSF